MLQKDDLFQGIFETLMIELNQFDRALELADRNAEITVKVMGDTYYVPVAQFLQWTIESDCRNINIYARQHRFEIDLPN